MGVDDRVVTPEGVGCMAGPRVVGRIGAHARANRVELDIAVAAQQVGVAIDEGGFVAAFPERARAAVAIVDVANVTPPQRLHEAGDLATALRGHQQVHVVGHQYIGVNLAAVAQRDFPEVLQIAMPIGIGEEAGLAIVAALDNVLGNAGEVDARPACHGRLLAKEAHHARGPATRLSLQADETLRKSAL